MLGNKHWASFLTAFCLELSVVQVRTLITDKGDFFHPGNCSQSQVCRISSLHPQSSIGVWTHGNTHSLLNKPPLQVLPWWRQWHGPHKVVTPSLNVLQPSFPIN